ncbi:MAG: response regulator transcription factor [Bacteroidota bacterium]
MNILVYSADTTFIERLSKSLQSVTYSIISFRNRKDAINFVCKDTAMLAVIDEGTDGIEFLTALKLIDEQLPVLFTASEKNVETKYKAFELGVDDCIDKSIPERELYHRVQSILKRSRIEPVHQLFENPVILGASTMDFKSRHFNCKDQLIQLSRKEADLLKVFYLNKGRVLSREDILKEVWKTSDYYASKSMDVYLTKLRKILQNEEMVEIKNIHGTGYIFSVN